MSEKKIAVLFGHGINCDWETAQALRDAAARVNAQEAIDVQRVHTNRFISGPRNLREYQMVVIPGGFLHADDVAAGKILAGKLKSNLSREITNFVEDGKLILGICNGFQVLTKYPLLSEERKFTLAANDCGRYQDRWVNLKVNSDTPCVYLRGIDEICLPVRHAEGKFVAGEAALLSLENRGAVALRYSTAEGEPAEGRFPHNPNGSLHDVAGVCDRTGRIFGLMPHPEAFITPYQYPGWTRYRRENGLPEPQGLKIFVNAVNYILEEM